MIFQFNNPNYPFNLLITEKTYQSAKTTLDNFLAQNPKYSESGDWILKDAIGSVAYNIYKIILD